MLLRPRLFRAAKLPPMNALYHAHARRFYSSFGLYTIIGLNTAVFAAWKYADNTIPVRIEIKDLGFVGDKLRVLQAMFTNFVFKSDDLQHGRWWTTITHAFSHNSVPHFAFNMIALHSFGGAVISYLPGVGPGALTTLYVGAAVAGSLGWYFQKQSSRSSERSAGALGASGSVSAFAAACALVAPNARWQLMFIPIGIPAWVMFSAYMAYDAYYMDDPNSRVGHSSHLAGAAFGAAHYLLYLRRFRSPFLR